MRKLAMVAVALVFTVGLVATFSQAANPKEYTIKQVMKAAMKKGGLLSKVASGSASPAQKKELLDLFEGLAKNEPPKGDPADWKTKTTALVDAAEAAVAGKAGSGAALKSAANCKGCHDAHKGK